MQFTVYTHPDPVALFKPRLSLGNTFNLNLLYWGLSVGVKVCKYDTVCDFTWLVEKCDKIKTAIKTASWIGLRCSLRGCLAWLGIASFSFVLESGLNKRDRVRKEGGWMITKVIRELLQIFKYKIYPINFTRISYWPLLKLLYVNI